MGKRTALNEQYKGLVERFAIPADLHERDARTYASCGSAVPVHCCTPEEVAARAASTHHYCGVFTDELLAPLQELAYVRLDEDTAEKVFLNRTKRILLTSSDGQLAQWRCAPTFESANRFVAGTPIADQHGAIVSVVTARRGNHYAVSTFEGDGGYFDTAEPWEVVDVAAGTSTYGDKTFSSRDELRAYVATLPPGAGGRRPLLLRGRSPGVALVADTGRQLARFYLSGVLADGVEYL